MVDLDQNSRLSEKASYLPAAPISTPMASPSLYKRLRYPEFMRQLS